MFIRYYLYIKADGILAAESAHEKELNTKEENKNIIKHITIIINIIAIISSFISVQHHLSPYLELY